MRRGFTRVELVVLLGVLGAAAVFGVQWARHSKANARDVKRVTDVRQVLMALKLFAEETNGYPYAPSAIRIGGSSALSLCKDPAATVAGSTFKSACGPEDATFVGVAAAAP